MDFYKIPIGFGMALAMNPPAMNTYAAMTEAQKQDILNKVHNVRPCDIPYQRRMAITQRRLIAASALLPILLPCDMIKGKRRPRL